MKATFSTWPITHPIPHQIGGAHELVFLAVSDAAIALVANHIHPSAMVIHHSGVLPYNYLSGSFQHTGCFWPVQSLTHGRTIPGSEIPWAGNATSEALIDVLHLTASRTDSAFHAMDDAKRAHLHLACVWANNFVNHTLSIAESMAENAGLDGYWLHPIMRETMEKFIAMGGSKAQTGPANRGDLPTIQAHEAALADHPLLLSLYRAFTKSIQKTAYPEN